MRILFVADFSEKSNGANAQKSQRRIANGFTRNGHDVLPFSERFFAKHLGLIKSRSMGRKATNQKLLDTAAIYQPDMLVLMHADNITLETLQILRDRDPALRVAQVNVDAMFLEDNVARLESKLSVVDGVFVTTGGAFLKRFAGDGRKAAFIPNPVDLSMDQGRVFDMAASDLLFDLFYARGAAAPDPARVDLPARIEKDLPQIRFDYRCSERNNLVFGMAYHQAMAACAMGLNISRFEDHGKIATADQRCLYSSDRLAHMVGSGLTLIMQAGDRREELFDPDNEALFFTGGDDLVAGLDRLLKDDDLRRRMGQAAWQRAHDQYNERAVAQFIEDVICKEKVAPRGWDTTIYG